MSLMTVAGKAYPGSRFRARLWPWVIAAVLCTVGANVVAAGVPALMPLLPLAALPMVALFVVFFVRSRPLQLALHVEGNGVRISGPRTSLVFTIVEVQLVPWILQGLGTAQGAVLLATVRDEAGQATRLALAAADVAAPPTAHAGCDKVDVFIDASDLQRLRDHFDQSGCLQSPPVRPGDDRRFALVRRTGFLDTAAVVLSWVGTMVVLGVFASLLGDRLTATPLGTAVFVLIGASVLGLGLWKTFQRSKPAKDRFELIVGNAQIEVRRADGETVWRLEGLAAPSRETYVYRTRYGSHRFAVIKIGTRGNELRLCVWDPRFANDRHPKGPAPDYLVGVPDWPRLEQALNAPA